VNLWGTSKYYDLAETCETFKKYGTDGFTIVHVFVRSLSKNLFKLEDFVTQLGALPDIIAVTETNINSNTNLMYNTSLHGY